MTETIIYAVFAGIFGAAIGSFINVLIDRIHNNTSLMGRSSCDFCQTPLSPYELIPIVSWVIQKGKCKNCHKKLSIQYPLVESFAAAVFIIIYLSVSQGYFNNTDYMGNPLHIMNYGFAIPLIYYLVIGTILVALTVADFKYGMLYDKIVFPTIVAVLLYKITTLLYFYVSLHTNLNKDAFGKALIQAGYLDTKMWDIVTPQLYSLIGAITIALFFLLLIVITRGRGMGGGDMKLGFLIGLITGWPYMIAAIFVGFLTGAIASVILIILGRKKIRQTIPFGPFLIAGCFVTMLWGKQLFEWYISGILSL